MFFYNALSQSLQTTAKYCLEKANSGISTFLSKVFTSFTAWHRHLPPSTIQSLYISLACKNNSWNHENEMEESWQSRRRRFWYTIYVSLHLFQHSCRFVKQAAKPIQQLLFQWELEFPPLCLYCFNVLLTDGVCEIMDTLLFAQQSNCFKAARVILKNSISTGSST